MTQPPNWGPGSDQLQQLSQMTQQWGQQWMQAMQALPGMACMPGAAPMAGMPGMPAMPGMPSFGAVGAPVFGAGGTMGGTPVSFDPDKLKALQEEYAKESMALWTEGAKGTVQLPKDRRFAGDAWARNPVAAFTAATYALNAKVLMGMADAVQGDEKTRARIRFGVEQWLAATAPSNFLALNAEAQQKAIDTQGQSITHAAARQRFAA